MQFADRYIETAEKIINSYEGSVPLHHYLKQFFAADKKYGSKDRKAITHACYCYYRLGKALNHRSGPEKIKAGIFLCNDVPGNWKGIYSEEWLKSWNVDLQLRLAFLQFHPQSIFPFQYESGNEVDKQAFALSHLIQPDLYLRIRPGKEVKVKKQLAEAGILFQACDNNCIVLPNATKIDQLLKINEDVVVQDISSQRVGELLSAISYHVSPIKVWDCCAASGGKSILAYDTLKNIELTVSDVRPSILQNLKKRFAEAGIKNYSSFVADLVKGNTSSEKYDLIICDAPCSGSGTWSRTPEQLSYFEEEKIDHYVNLQQKITSAVIPSLKENGFLLYITCSVFRKENEGIVDHIQAHSSLKLVKMQYLKGYDKKADTMFAALFTASKP